MRVLKNFLLAMLVSLITTIDLSAQGTHRVTGVVKDAGGEPLIGVQVIPVGAVGSGAATGLDGSYAVLVPAGINKLKFTYVGMQEQIIDINGRTKIDVVMHESQELLETVVVTALGIKRSQKALSYNVQEMKGDVLTKVKDANFMNSLSGKVAGVSIQRSSSGVGGGTRVVMRGNKSISGDNNVLYVIDGVPVANNRDASDDSSGFGSGRTSSEGISNINPDDIESLSVLTGPSAAALYGASAANGVILINTKKGASGALKVNFSSSVETASPFVLPRFQTTYGNKPGEYMSWGNKLDTPSSFDPKSFFNTGTTFNNSVNLTVGTEKNQTYFSAAAINADGIVPNNKYHRYNVLLRNTAKFLNDKLTLDASVSYVREFSNNMVAYGTYFNPIVGLYLYPRGENFEAEKYFERYNEEKGYAVQQWTPGAMGDLDAQNPYWIAYRNLRPEVKDRYMFFGSVRYDVTNELNLTARARLDNTHAEREDKRYASTVETHARPLGRYSNTKEDFRQKYLDFMANYTSQLSDAFHLTANVGTSYEEYDTKSQGYGGQLLLIPNKFIFANIDSSTGAPTQGGGPSRRSNFAAFASAELGWRSAMYLTLTGRADKPSQLVNSADPWIFYPSVGLSTVVTELLSDQARASLRPVLSFLKVRGSFTEVGSPIPFTGLTPGTVTHSMSGGKVLPYDYYPLPELKAERTRSFELGLDSRWFNGLINLGVTVYHSNTYNQLLPVDIDPGTGYSKLYVQAGNVRNRGIEMTLGLDKTWGDFNYNTTITATANRNRIIELSKGVINPITKQLTDLSIIDIGRFRLTEGGEIGDVYAKTWLKRDQDGYVNFTPGSLLQTENTTPYKLGSVNAKWNFGWRNGFSYKGLDLNFLITARLGGIVISKTQAVLDQFGVSETSAKARDLGHIQLGNFQVDPYGYYQVTSTLDSYYTYSATNVRLQEVSLSYRLPKKLLGKVFDHASLSVFGTNLLMIYNKAPYDPELTASTGTFGQGYDYFMMPSQRTLGVSLKLGI